MSKIAIPSTDEYAPFYRAYVESVGGEPDVVALLERQVSGLQQLRTLTPERAAFRYADGKWSVRQLIGHVADAERVFSYRLLRVARGDQTPLPGFDENAYVAQSNADDRDAGSLVDELAAIRASTLALVRSLDEDALARRGTASDAPVSGRALVFIIAGHFAHHMGILRDRYRVAID